MANTTANVPIIPTKSGRLRWVYRIRSEGRLSFSVCVMFLPGPLIETVYADSYVIGLQSHVRIDLSGQEDKYIHEGGEESHHPHGLMLFNL